MAGAGAAKAATTAAAARVSWARSGGTLFCKRHKDHSSISCGSSRRRRCSTQWWSQKVA